MLIVYDEFVDESDVKRKGKNINERREAMWRLANELLRTFENDLPEESMLFKESTQLTWWLSAFFTCYGKGVVRFEAILRQDVELTERKVVKGRRRKDITEVSTVEMELDKELEPEPMEIDQ